MSNTVEFFGETFTLSPDVSEFALMEFAEAAADGVDGDTMQGMASMLRLILDCLAEPEPVVETAEDGTETVVPQPSERARFRAVARKNRAAAKDLMPVIQAAFEGKAERPTGRSSDSSDGPGSTGPKSGSNSAVKGLERLAGRPDLQIAVVRTREVASA